MQAASARGLKVLITVYDAPSWAEGSNRPGNAPAGTWKPDPGKFRQFATALASRYSGSFGGLPRVRYFQALNEPNLSGYLNPQYKHKTAKSPGLYRELLNGFYAGVKSVHKDNKVLTAGTAPYGDPRGGDRMHPISFWRKALCVKHRCQHKAKFDILAHHPIDTSGGPHRSAVSPLDAATPDLHNVIDVLRNAERKHRVKGGHHPVWATELWWESDPPDHVQGVPVKRHARWLEEALYVLWKQGAQAVINLQIRDSEFTQQTAAQRDTTGIYFHSGKAKPARRAWSFPFVTHRKSGKKVKTWGKAPAGGKLSIQRKHKGHWRTVRRVSVHAGEIFHPSLRMSGSGTLRAGVGGEKSMAWKQGG